MGNVKWRVGVKVKVKPESEEKNNNNTTRRGEASEEDATKNEMKCEAKRRARGVRTRRRVM